MHFKYILFDLDDTLYPKEAGVMNVVSERILDYMIQKMDIPADDATQKKHNYYQKYGTVLRGLMEEHHINPQDYLNYVHNFDPKDYLGPSPPLNRMLEEIPLEKVIFTNADIVHSTRVLDALNVRAHFKQIINVQTLNYENKPRPKAYKQVLEILDAPGDTCIMVDDTPRNLIPAKDLCMTTILVNSNHKSLAVDYAVPTVFHVESVVKSILPLERL
jgi:putative hydrolase of the HAD superfamily